MKEENFAVVMPVSLYRGLQWWNGWLRHTDIIMSPGDTRAGFVLFIGNIAGSKSIRQVLRFCSHYVGHENFMGFIWRAGSIVTERWGIQNGGIRGHENRYFSDGENTRFLRLCHAFKKSKNDHVKTGSDICEKTTG